jgi:ABC-2 type transport system permease protein
MNVILMPMWLFSGAVFPLTPSTPWLLKALMWANPLTYGQNALSGLLLGENKAQLSLPILPSLLVFIAFTAAACLVATLLARRPGKGN